LSDGAAPAAEAHDALASHHPIVLIAPPSKPLSALALTISFIALGTVAVMGMSVRDAHHNAVGRVARAPVSTTSGKTLTATASLADGSPTAPALAPSMPPSLFPTIDSGEQDPVVLLSDVRRIASLGVPVEVENHVLDTDDFRRALITADEPEIATLTRSGRLPSLIRFAHVPVGSLLDHAGLRNGDIVLSLNGSGYPTISNLVPSLWGRRHASLIEVIRDARRVVLFVSTPGAPSGADQAHNNRSHA